MAENLTLTPIGYYRGKAKYPYDVPRQGSIAEADGVVELLPGKNFHQALEQLEGFSHIWLIFWFHRNSNWHPKVRPPRHLDEKVGVFASRSPHRPNPIGISAVRLLKVDGLKLFVADCDLLDGTPVFDVKPYLKYADSFVDATDGWTSTRRDDVFQVHFEPEVVKAVEWLEKNGVPCIGQFIRDRLEFEPTDDNRHRVMRCNDYEWILAYRTWRIIFCVDAERHLATVKSIVSGYATEDFEQAEDVYGDFDIHKRYMAEFG